MKQVVVSLCVLVLLGSAVVAAPPTTKPAAKPDPNSVAVAFETFGFQLFVPKAWKQGVRNDHGVTFQLPAGGFIVLAGKTKGQFELKAAVDGTKKNLTDTVKGMKLIKDEATTLGGQEAWMLVYDAQLTAKEIDPKTGKPLADGKSMSVTNRTMQVMAGHEGSQVQLIFTCGDKTFDGQSKNAKRAIDTFEWTPPKPADEKKTDATQK